MVNFGDIIVSRLLAVPIPGILTCLFAGITLIVANKHTNTAETYQIQCETVAATDVWLDYFNGIVGAGT